MEEYYESSEGVCSISLRIAIGGISHETNTFCHSTEIGDFHEHQGQEIVQRHGGGIRTYVGGMLEAAKALDLEAVPTYLAHATPSGTISAGALGTMLARLQAALREAGPVDGVCLSLHGAGVAEGCDDLETATLRAVREVVGPETPLVATLDLHGNLFAEMLDFATALFGVHLYPHLDCYERGQQAMGCLKRVIDGDVHPQMALETLPLIVPTTASSVEPVHSVNELCFRCEQRDGVLDAVFFHGFAHTDIPDVHASVLVVTDGDRALAREVAGEVASYAWRRRGEFDVHHPGAEAALTQVRQALAEVGGPVVVNDTSDNPGGGGPGDGTHLLRAMLDHPVASKTAFGFVYDPETAAQAHRAGVGETISVRLGGRTYPLHGEPIAVEAYVKCLTDGQFVLTTPMGRGSQVDLGPMARLVIGGVDVLVSSVRSQTLDPQVFLLHGIDVASYELVALKSSNHFRGGFASIASRIITADTPGLTSCNLRSMPYRRLRRPVAPLDPETTFTPGFPADAHDMQWEAEH